MSTIEAVEGGAYEKIVQNGPNKVILIFFYKMMMLQVTCNWNFIFFYVYVDWLKSSINIIKKNKDTALSDKPNC